MFFAVPSSAASNVVNRRRVVAKLDVSVVVFIVGTAT